jgi:uncharacterized protein GlcG (DUF336 family)
MKTLLHSIAVALTLSTVVPSAQAQMINPNQTMVITQSSVVNKKALTLEGAKAVIAAAVAAARQKQAPGGAIAVVDDGIEVEGQVIGAIGVSGAASAQQDEEIAIAGAMALR